MCLKYNSNLKYKLHPSDYHRAATRELNRERSGLKFSPIDILIWSWLAWLRCIVQYVIYFYQTEAMGRQPAQAQTNGINFLLKPIFWTSEIFESDFSKIVIRIAGLQNVSK